MSIYYMSGVGQGDGGFDPLTVGEWVKTPVPLTQDPGGAALNELL